MLLRLKDQIVNTDHIIRAKYTAGPKATLLLWLSDYGEHRYNEINKMPHVVGHTLMFTGTDAQLIWSMLTQMATAVVPALPKKA